MNIEYAVLMAIIVAGLAAVSADNAARRGVGEDCEAMHSFRVGEKIYVCERKEPKP